jgi:hypothetical protein
VFVGRRSFTSGTHIGLPPSHFHLQVRGKKTKTTLSFDELPQGPLPAPAGAAPDEPLPEETGPAYPTVVMQARHNMNKYDNCVLLTRVGGFYELYFEHAEEYGPLLNLKVAQKKTGAGPVPMVISIVLWCLVDLMFLV